MNTAVHNHRRVTLPVLNLVLAAGAAVLAIIAIESDDVGSASVATTAPVVTIVGPAHPLGAVSVGIPCDELIYTRC